MRRESHRGSQGVKAPARTAWHLLAWLVGALFLLAPSDTLRMKAVASVASVAAPTLEGNTLCVQVVDESNGPLDEATVRVYRELSERRFAVAGESTTRTGRTCFERLAAGTLWVLAEAPRRMRASLQSVFHADASLTLTLKRAAKLSVRVVDELSAPLDGATVLVSSADPLPFGKRTRNGVAEFTRLPPAPWTIQGAAPGYESVTQNGVTENTTLTLRRLASLDVHVVDARGAPVEGAAVVIAGSTLWPARRATTDSVGLAKIRGLAAGTYDLRATAESRISNPLPGFELVRGAHEKLTLRLEPGRMVTAVVTDGEGERAPVVAGADVVLVEDGIGSFPLRGRTGADGKVTLGPIASGAATLVARAADFVGSPLVAVPDVLLAPIPVPLLRGSVLRGEVVDASGYPIEGAQIEVVGTDRFGLPIAETPLSVNFRALHFAWTLSGPAALVPSGELGVMPGPVPPIPRPGAAFSAVSSGIALPPLETSEAPIAPWMTRSNGEFVAKPVSPGRVRALVRHPEFVEGTSELVALPPASEQRVKIVLLRGGRLEGRVVDERSYPVRGAEIELLARNGTFERTTFTADDGAFAFAAVPREVTLSASRPEDPQRVALRKSLAVPEGQRVDVELVLPPPRGAVRVTVTDERDEPVELAEVRLASLDAAVPLRTTGFTDASGAVEFPDAVGLSARVTVMAPRFAVLQRDFDPMPAETRLALDTGVTLAGRVTAVRGRRAATNALVTLRAGTQRKSTMTDEEGAYSFAGVAPGRIQLVVSHPDYAEVSIEAEVARTTREDRPFEIAPIDLPEPGEIEGRVIDARGDPVEGARVAIGAAPTHLPQGALPTGVALTDRDGAFVLRRAAAGRVRVEAYAASLGRGRLDGVVVDPGRTTSGLVIALRERDVEETEPLATGGVAITLSERGGELAVARVAAGSEADRGGLREGDVLVNVDGVRATALAETRARLVGPAGSDVLVTVTRDGTELRLRVTREPIRR